MQTVQAMPIAVATFAVAIAWYDVRERRIPNFLVFPTMLFGLLFHLFSPVDGRLVGLKGIVAGLLLLIVPYASGGMKAGDVKFLMAIGALVGWQGAVNTLLAALLIYPVIALFFVIRERKFLLTWLRFRRLFLDLIGFVLPGAKLYAMRLALRDSSGIDSVRTPFGLSLAAGVLLVLLLGGDWPVESFSRF